MANSLETRLLKDSRIFEFHTNDMPAFTNMEYVTPFVFERELWVEKIMYGHLTTLRQWFIDYWQSSFLVSLVYVIVIFSLKKYMDHRKRYELQRPLFVWSLVLAIFSIIGAVRTITEFVQLGLSHGFYHVLCYPSLYYGSTAFWSFIFVVSKLYELGDTVFIVLRKQPLIFLHWYHHLTVLIFCCLTYTDHSAPGRWFSVMNYIVHSFMYTYYALRAAKITVPKFVNIIITTMQIVQMTIGIGVCAYAYHLKTTGIYCHISYTVLYSGILMYISYFVLFGNYFYHTYLSKSKKQTPRKLSNSQNGDINLTSKNLNGVRHRTFSNGFTNGVIKSNEVHNDHVNSGSIHSEKSHVNGFTKKDE